MDVRIGVIHSPRELTFELGDDADRDALRAAADAALAGDSPVFWISDKRGREVAVPATKIAYIELGSDDAAPGIGFGSS